MTQATLLQLTSAITVAYVEHNRVPSDQIPSLIASVHLALTNAVTGGVSEASATPPSLTPTQIRKSITRDISFEDGRPYRALRRHLSVKGMTPDDYRAKWGLPRDYPMVAPSYSEARSAMAKELGLGFKGRGAAGKAAKPAPRRGPGRPRKNG